MNKKALLKALPVLFGFYVMGFCDIVGISSDYAKEAFGWSNTMAGLIPSMVFVWFLFLGIPVGIYMNSYGRKNVTLFSMWVTVAGMLLPLVAYNSFTCMAAYALLGIGNAMLQVSLNPLLGNVVEDKKLLTSSLTAGQVIKALSSLSGPYIVWLGINWMGDGTTACWYYCFPLLGGITLLSGLWLALTPIKREASAPDGESSFFGTLSLLRDKTILLLFLGIFFVVGVDVATNFISSKVMAVRFGWTMEEAGIAPQIYFFSRTVGAFIGVFLMTKISEVKYFRANILVCIAALVALAIGGSETTDLVCIGAVGFLCSCIFPIIYAMALKARPDKANVLSGLMITAVAGGGAVTPALGAAMDCAGIGGGVAVILVCVLYLTYCAFGVKERK